MTVEEIIAAAQAQTGLSDYGDSAILEGLQRLLKGYAEEARFTERGSQMAHADLVTNLSIRMKVEGWLKDHPAAPTAGGISFAARCLVSNGNRACILRQANLRVSHLLQGLASLVHHLLGGVHCCE